MVLIQAPSLPTQVAVVFMMFSVSKVYTLTVPHPHCHIHYPVGLRQTVPVPGTHTLHTAININCSIGDQGQFLALNVFYNYYTIHLYQVTYHHSSLYHGSIATNISALNFKFHTYQCNPSPPSLNIVALM